MFFFCLKPRTIIEYINTSIALCFTLLLRYFFVRMASEANVSNANSKEVPKIGKDPFWEHGEKVGVKVRCKFCDHKISGGISRLKKHLAHERENCLPCT